MLSQVASTEFEFSEQLLIFIMDSTISGRFDTFLFPNGKRFESDRSEGTSIYRFLEVSSKKVNRYYILFFNDMYRIT